jgi:hypothetical protein
MWDRGSDGPGRRSTQRLLDDSKHVVDAPAKLAARGRLFDTGHNRMTDVRAVAVVAVDACCTSLPPGFRLDTQGQRYYQRSLAEGNTPDSAASRTRRPDTTPHIGLGRG